MRLRDAIDSHPLLAKYTHCLSTAELIPAEFRPSGMNPTQQAAHARTVRKETAPCAPLPDFTGFHRAFLDHAGAGDHPTREGDVRRAYFLSYDDTRYEYLQADEVGQRMEAGQPMVSATLSRPTRSGSRCSFQASCSARRSWSSCAAWTPLRCTAMSRRPATASIPARRSRSPRTNPDHSGYGTTRHPSPTAPLAAGAELTQAADHGGEGCHCRVLTVAGGKMAALLFSGSCVLAARLVLTSLICLVSLTDQSDLEFRSRM